MGQRVRRRGADAVRTELLLRPPHPDRDRHPYTHPVEIRDTDVDHNPVSERHDDGAGLLERRGVRCR